MPILHDAFDAAGEGQERVVALSKNYLHRGLEKIILAARLKQWSDLFQALRRS